MVTFASENCRNLIEENRLPWLSQHLKVVEVIKYLVMMVPFTFISLRTAYKYPVTMEMSKFSGHVVV